MIVKLLHALDTDLYVFETTSIDKMSNNLTNGCGAGQVVSIFTMYYNDQISNPIKRTVLCKICVWKDRKKQKEARVGPFNKNVKYTSY